MPYLSKQALSQYIRTECLRQLRLNLYPANRCSDERKAQQMPDEQPPRPGLDQLKQAGEEWQEEKLHDLHETFGSALLRGDAIRGADGHTRYRNQDLLPALSGAVAGQFLIEAQYDITPAFEAAVDIDGYRDGYDLQYARVRPDIIHVLAPGTFRQSITPRGDIEQLPDGDQRVQLRVIEIKLTAEPSPNYFAEITYYAMALAGWLAENLLADQYVVVPDGAVWPGSHDASALRVGSNDAAAAGKTLSADELVQLLEQDLEVVPFAVFAPRVRRFLAHDVPAALKEADWKVLPWHVDNRCKGCDYLGYAWRSDKAGVDASHCIPMAEQASHLSRVAFITRGSKAALEAGKVRDVSQLAIRKPGDRVFDTHQTLRSMRTVIPTRARALAAGTATVAPDSGTSAIMPRWAHLRIFVTTDFDVGSGITLALGLKSFWIEPIPYNERGTRKAQTAANQPQVFIIDTKSPDAERRELLAFLASLHAALDEAHKRSPDTTIQIYLWDDLQFRHLMRIIGRHLDALLANDTLAYLAWLFPPEELLPNPEVSATRATPITIVRDVVRAVVAAPVAHYYSLFEVARSYHRANDDPKFFTSVHPLFHDPLSDQIPSERAHEIWARVMNPRRLWKDQMRIVEETVKKRLRALEAVTSRLQEDLGATLRGGAPKVTVIGPLDPADKLANDSQLWYAFAKLDAAMNELEVHHVWAMPPHEREARFHSAVLTERLTGRAETQALQTLKIAAQPYRRVYKVADSSRGVKIREGDFTFALAPKEDPGFLDQTLAGLGRRISWSVPEYAQRRKLSDVTSVSIVTLDQDRGLIVLDAKPYNNIGVDTLEGRGINLSKNVMLERTYRDFFTDKLKTVLRAIGNPEVARTRTLTGSILHSRKRARATAHTPPASFLWDAASLAGTSVDRDAAASRAALESAGIDLNERQWEAFAHALTHRLALIWGPPGTGKSRTMRAVALGAVADAVATGRPLRILICSATYRALDNVLLGVHERVGSVAASADVVTRRLRSAHKPPSVEVDAAIDLELNRAAVSPALDELRERLRARQGVTIVGATESQVYNLMTMNGGGGQQELFDLILIDEASQMDVGRAILAVAAMADGGAVVLAGDPKQLPPIRQAEPPKDMEALVGSVYSFIREVHGVAPIMLNRNYRSNETIVQFVRSADYDTDLTAVTPARRLPIQAPFATTKPADWPSHLGWTDAWATILDPAAPTTCFVYSDGRSSQWNDFEADSIAAMVTLAARHLADDDGALLDPDVFWTKGVGIVTPHRAQQAVVTARLLKSFPNIAPAIIRGAVDTVERFQGQERELMFATYALGDPDAIGAEDEFLLNFNRFNVVASRARTKLVVLISQEVVNHLCAELDALRGSALLKTYVESFCRTQQEMVLPAPSSGLQSTVTGSFRFLQS